MDTKFGNKVTKHNRQLAKIRVDVETCVKCLPTEIMLKL